MIIEFENIRETDLVAALHRALYEAKLAHSTLAAPIEKLVRQAERDDADRHRRDLH